MLDQDVSVDDFVLSALLNHRECVVSLMEIDKIPVEYFDSDEHRKMYRNITRWYTKYSGKSICTPKLIKEQCEKMGKPSIETARVFAYYNYIAGLNTTINEYPVYVAQLKERAYKRMLQVSVKAAGDLCNKDNNPIQAAHELLKTSAQIKMLSADDRIVRTTLAEQAKELQDRYMFAKTRKDEAMGLFTGFFRLDQITWGIQPGEVLIVAGPTGGGKSVTLVAMAAHIYNGMRFCKACAFQLYKHSEICPSCGADVKKPESVYSIKGKNVAYISIEMPAEDCLRRFVSSSLGIRSKDLQRGQLGATEEAIYFDYLKHVKENVNPGLFMIDVPRGVDADFIDSELDRIEATSGVKIDVVIIDYMQLMTPKSSKRVIKEGDWKEQDAIAAEIHELARNRRIPAISAVQTTSVRSLKSEQMRYGTHRVARAEGIANNVNIIIQIEDVIEDEKKSSSQATDETMTITYHVIKNRDGPKGVIQMQKDFSKMQINHMVDFKYAQTE